MCDLLVKGHCFSMMFIIILLPFIYQMKVSLAGLSELRSVCEKGLLLLAITIPEMEVKSLCIMLI